MHGVHFTKGCYLGQEIVERVRARGAVHKGLAAVTFVASAKMPAQDAELFGGGVKAGYLLSVVHSPAENCSVGFAVLAVEYLGGDKQISCDGVEVRLRPSNAFAAR